MSNFQKNLNLVEKNLNIRVIKLVLIYTIVLFLIILIPLIWKNSIEFNVAKFTEEWYKGCFSLFQLLIGFIIFNYLFNRYKFLEEERGVIRALVKINTAIKNMQTSFEFLIQYTKGDSELWSKQEHDKIMKHNIEIIMNNIGFIESHGIGVGNNAISELIIVYHNQFYIKVIELYQLLIEKKIIYGNDIENISNIKSTVDDFNKTVNRVTNDFQRTSEVI